DVVHVAGGGVPAPLPGSMRIRRQPRLHVDSLAGRTPGGGDSLDVGRVSHRSGRDDPGGGPPSRRARTGGGPVAKRQRSTAATPVRSSKRARLNSRVSRTCPRAVFQTYST